MSIKFNGGTREWEAWTSLLFSIFDNFFSLWNSSLRDSKFHVDFLSTLALPPLGRDLSSFIEMAKIVKKIMLNGKKSHYKIMKG